MRDDPAPAPIVPDPLEHPNPEVAAVLRTAWEIFRAERNHGIPSPEWHAAAAAHKAAMDELDSTEFFQATDIIGREMRRRWNAEAMPRVNALLAAGWSIDFDGMEGDLDTWQFAWRRPSRRPGKPGRRFASTTQAWNQLQRERGDDGHGQ